MKAPRDRFIHIADLHFWQVVWNPFALFNKRFLGNMNVLLRRRFEFRMDRAEQYLDAVTALGPRFALLTGDFTSTSTEREFAMGLMFTRALHERGFELAVLPGNHDVYTFGAHRRRRFAHHFRQFVPPEGYPARMTLPGGTPLILAPTVTPNALSSAGRITDAEAAEVRALLDACPPGPVLVAGHYPVLDRTPHYHLSDSRRLRNAGALRRVLGEADRPILYLAGHVHVPSHVQDPEYPKLRHLTTEAFFLHEPGADVSGAFASIAVWDDDFEVTRHVRYDAWHPEPLPLEANVC